MTSYHEIETALRELTRDDWERVAKSVVVEFGPRNWLPPISPNDVLVFDEPMPNEDEEYRLWAEGYMD